MHVDGDYAGWP